MTVTAIHQFLPSFSTRDAIGGHARQIQRVLQEQGFESEIYAQFLQPDTRAIARDAESFPTTTQPGTAIMYHLSTGSGLARWCLERQEPLVVDYHNITPAEFFAGWEPTVAAELRRGRIDLRQLAPRVAMGFADSAFNVGELEDLGYPKCAVVPILIDPADFAHEVDAVAEERIGNEKADGGADLLFVGRVSPNKCQHDLIKVLAAYRAAYDPSARLRIVGGASSHAYLTALGQYAAGLGLGDAVDIAGSVTPGELAAYYRMADAFVCVSEHEGFCVPVIEAMAHDVPVVSFEAAALPETVGDGGVLLPSKSPTVVAAAVHRVMSDQALRDRLVAAGRQRVDTFSLAAGRAHLQTAVDEFLAMMG
ncbi:MAG: glycosyltransferase family 4 protein [Acidimicrobiia bacterium]